MLKLTILSLFIIITPLSASGYEYYELQPVIPEWIQNIFKYYGDGQINDQELINAIQYLAKNGVIQIN